MLLSKRWQGFWQIVQLKLKLSFSNKQSALHQFLENISVRITVIDIPTVVFSIIEVCLSEV